MRFTLGNREIVNAAPIAPHSFVSQCNGIFLEYCMNVATIFWTTRYLFTNSELLKDISLDFGRLNGPNSHGVLIRPFWDLGAGSNLLLHLKKDTIVSRR